MEGINANGGSCYPRPGYLERVRELCDEYGIVFCMDEIITGFRVGLGGAQQVLGVTPDLTTFGKGVAGGIPLSVVAGKAEIMDLCADRTRRRRGHVQRLPARSGRRRSPACRYLEKDDGVFYRNLAATQKRLTDGLREIMTRHGRQWLLQDCPGVIMFYPVPIERAWTIGDWYGIADHALGEKLRQALFDDGRPHPLPGPLVLQRRRDRATTWTAPWRSSTAASARCDGGGRRRSGRWPAHLVPWPSRVRRHAVQQPVVGVEALSGPMPGGRSWHAWPPPGRGPRMASRMAWCSTRPFSRSPGVGMACSRTWSITSDSESSMMTKRSLRVMAAIARWNCVSIRAALGMSSIAADLRRVDPRELRDLVVRGALRGQPGQLHLQRSSHLVDAVICQFGRAPHHEPEGVAGHGRRRRARRSTRHPAGHRRRRAPRAIAPPRG